MPTLRLPTTCLSSATCRRSFRFSASTALSAGVDLVGTGRTVVSGSAARIQLRSVSVLTPRSAATEANVTPGRERYNATASALNSDG